MRGPTLKHRSATHLGFVVYDSWADGTILLLGQGLANFFFKGPDSKYFRFGMAESYSFLSLLCSLFYNSKKHKKYSYLQRIL